MADTLRIGALGASRIAPFALFGPARRVDGVEVVAVAARSRDRAAKYAKKHRIPTVHADYDALLADPDLDAVYVPLPNSHHHDWAIKALEAGKHVLCEKPMASNAEEAGRMRDAARDADKQLMEAFHWRYHPLAKRAIDLLRSGAVGTIQRVETQMCIPLPMSGDIRFRLDLAGGAMMDVGAYAVSMQRHLSGEEPQVVSATPWLKSEGVDRLMEAELRYASGATGFLRASLWSRYLLAIRFRVVGDAGELRAFNPIAPQIGYASLVLKNADGTQKQDVSGEPTYVCQLRAFKALVQDGVAVPTDGADAVANMGVIDAVYRAAGMEPRRSPV